MIIGLPACIQSAGMMVCATVAALEAAAAKR
jgi:hypothetical protein